ncbi:MAG: hypothetical protein NFCOHLIN_01393 [Gammaproteobacteria bacterium]|nr:hypothetical protein [Gammaproteobacteria bacterium]
MRRRLYFVLPDVNVARQVEDDLLLARIESRRMHFLGKRGTDLKDLPEAGLAQKSDLIHGMATGLVAGAIAGALVGLYLFVDPVLGTGPGPAKVLAGALGGALFGIWVAGMVGISTPNSVLRRFERTMAEGHILLMVDVPRERIEAVRHMVLSRHPQVEDHGLEPTVPAFP